MAGRVLCAPYTHPPGSLAPALLGGSRQKETYTKYHSQEVAGLGFTPKQPDPGAQAWPGTDEVPANVALEGILPVNPGTLTRGGTKSLPLSTRWSRAGGRPLSVEAARGSHTCAVTRLHSAAWCAVPSRWAGVGFLLRQVAGGSQGSGV